MTPTEGGLSGLFEQTRRFCVPLYQRRYTWDTENFERLWTMVTEKLDQRLAGKKPRPRFLGTIVLTAERAVGASLRSDLVIDGQQRLTTLQLMLGALRDYLLAGPSPVHAIAAQLERLTANYVPMDGSRDERYKVWPTQLDQEQFTSCMEPVHTATADHLAIKESKASGLRLVRAYRYFMNEVAELFAEHTPAHSAEQLAHSLHQVLLNDLRVVTIDLGDHDDPQEIFETLNYGGAPLLPSDLLRNWVLLRANAAELNVHTMYEKYWARFDREPWNSKRSIGRLTRLQIDVLLNHYLQSQLADTVNVEHLYTAYRDWSRERAFSSVPEELQQLNHYADIWLELDTPNPVTSTGRLAAVIDEFEVGPAIPLALYLRCEAKVPDAEFTSMVTMLESYLVRRALCNLTAKNYNRFFLRLIETLRSQGASAAVLRAELLAGNGNAVVWPTDTMFKEALLEKPLYEIVHTPRLQWFLWQLELALRTAKTENLPKPANLSIEHVMPQEWRTHWMMPDGQPATSKSPADVLLAMLDNDPRAQQEHERDQCVHTLGNLTLVTQSLNPALSNDTFTAKRPELQRYSLLQLSQDVTKDPEWNPTRIRGRGERLANTAVSRFPR